MINDNHPTNLVEFECQEVKHRFGLDKYPGISTEALVVAARNIINSMDVYVKIKKNLRL